MPVETRDQCCLVLGSEQKLQSSFGLFFNFEGNYQSNFILVEIGAAWFLSLKRTFSPVLAGFEIWMGKLGTSGSG